MPSRRKFFFLGLVVYAALVSFVTFKVTKKEDKICPTLQIANTHQQEQGYKEKAVENFTEEIEKPNGTKIKRAGTKEISIEDYLKTVRSRTVAVQIPPEELDNFSVDAKFKNVEKFPNVSLKSADIGVRLTDHYWATYQKDFENGDNVFGVRYTTKVCLWRCP